MTNPPAGIEQQMVWRGATSAPRDGTLILVVMHDFTVYACRFGEADDGTKLWFEPDWSGAVMDADDERDRIAGWLPFPALHDPWPSGPVKAIRTPTQGETG